MSHKPIQFRQLCLTFPHKVCFENFTTEIHYGSRIGLIGRNGSGKSTLLSLIYGDIPRPEGEITVPRDVIFGYVPQMVSTQEKMSGSQGLNKALTHALSLSPNVLLLDEPTNHLDQENRKSLLRMLNRFSGTLIVASHDPQLLNVCVDTLWHIEAGQVRIFHGRYREYQHEYAHRRASLEHELALLRQEKRQAHEALMKEQERAKKSNLRGEKHIEQRKWPTIVSREKARRAVETSGRKKSAIFQNKQEVMEQLAALTTPQVIRPKFSFTSSLQGDKTILSITDGAVGYGDMLLEHIHLSLMGGERLALMGANGTGKSTLFKGILNHPSVVKEGRWTTPKREDIGYLDQQYATLDPDKTVLESLQSVGAYKSHADLRRYLNDFLFFKNEEVNGSVATLSGGEKARLSLALIAAQVPKLLLLDEITNNLDLETRSHVIQVLKEYPGAFMIISHDEDFLSSIQITYPIHMNQFLARKS